MIVMHEKKAASGDKALKPVLCLKCERGVIGHIPEESEAVLSKRGKPPPEEHGDYLQVRCFVCRSRWSLTIEN